jgi:hypothetical protein
MTWLTQSTRFNAAPWLCSAILGVGLWFFAHGQALADRRVALVIGNGEYRHVPHLSNPSHDAADVAAILRRAGFEVIHGVDLDQIRMREVSIDFARAARTADVAVFYYSGHALQYSGVNYLAPVDVRLQDEADLRRMARVDEILADLQQAKNLRILVLDSCRDNPLASQLKRSVGLTRAASIQNGLAKIEAPEGTIIAYATQAGHTAEDGSGRNSPYTAAFLKHIAAPQEIGTVFRLISADVYETTKRAQLPELSLSLIGQFYLNGNPDATEGTLAGTRRLDQEAEQRREVVFQRMMAAMQYNRFRWRTVERLAIEAGVTEAEAHEILAAHPKEVVLGKSSNGKIIARLGEH